MNWRELSIEGYQSGHWHCLEGQEWSTTAPLPQPLIVAGPLPRCRRFTPGAMQIAHFHDKEELLQNLLDARLAGFISLLYSFDGILSPTETQIFQHLLEPLGELASLKQNVTPAFSPGKFNTREPKLQVLFHLLEIHHQSP